MHLHKHLLIHFQEQMLHIQGQHLHRILYKWHVHKVMQGQVSHIHWVSNNKKYYISLENLNKTMIQSHRNKPPQEKL